MIGRAELIAGARNQPPSEGSRAAQRMQKGILSMPLEAGQSDQLTRPQLEVDRLPGGT